MKVGDRIKLTSDILPAVKGEVGKITNIKEEDAPHMRNIHIEIFVGIRDWQEYFMHADVSEKEIEEV